jgi:hypothetical protein
MAMNVRLGFARLARVAAATYLLVAGITVVLVTLGAWNERQRDLHPTDFTVAVQDGRTFRLRATYPWEAQSAADSYAIEHPVPSTDGPWKAYARANAAPAPASGTVADMLRPQNGEFTYEEAVGRPSPPVRLSLPEYDHPPSLGSVFWRALVVAFWFAVAYAVLWTFFRVLRWVLLGFMEDGPIGA